MAQRRMFNLKIIDTDAFLDMPATTQVLYFHLSMRADDDGFIGNPKRIMRMVGASDDDMRILIAKQFVIPFESGVCVIKHWRIHNYIQKDRYNPTFHKYEKELLTIGDDQSYKLISQEKMDTKCIHDVSKTDTQVSIGYSYSKDNNKYMCVDTHMPPSPSAPAECVSSSEKQKKRKKQEDYTEDFEEFWTSYPRKVEKKTAYKAWNARIKNGTNPQEMIQAAKNYARYCQLNGTEERFIKHPSTFIGPNEPYKEYVNFSPHLPQRSSQTSEDRIADIQRKIAQANREAVEMWDE